MIKMRLVRQVWNGTRLLGQMAAANAKAVFGFGDAVTAAAKDRVHAEFAGSPDSTGRLERSIHVSLESSDHTNDMELAQYSDLEDPLATIESLIEDSVTNERGTFVLIAGSWLDYACVVESGRKLQYMGTSVDQLQGTQADAIVFGAYREMGLAGGGY